MKEDSLALPSVIRLGRKISLLDRGRSHEKKGRRKESGGQDIHRPYTSGKQELKGDSVVACGTLEKGEKQAVRRLRILQSQEGLTKEPPPVDRR